MDNNDQMNEIVQNIGMTINGNASQIEQATNFILEFQKHPENIFPLFQILQTNSNPLIKEQTAVFIRQMIVKTDLYGEDASPVYAEQLKLLFFETIQSPTIGNALRQVLFGANEVLFQGPDVWDEYIQFVLNLISADDKITLGFEIFSEITTFIPEQINNEQFALIISRIDACLESEDSNLRIAAMKLLFSYAENVDPEAFSTKEDIAEKLVIVAKNSVTTYANEVEANIAFNLLHHLLTIEIPLFQNLQTQICVSILEIAAAKEISAELRACTNPILIITPKFFTEEDVEQLTDLTIHTSLDLCIELNAAGQDISFLPFVFDSIIGNGYQTDEIIQTLISSCQSSIQSGDKNQLYVIITALIGCIAEGSEFLANHSQELFEIIVTCLDDEDMFEIACIFISEASVRPEVLAENFEQYVDSLSQKVPLGRSLESLDKILFTSLTTYPDLEKLLSFLVEQFDGENPQLFSSVMSCITSAISKVKSDSGLYESLVPVLVQYMEVEDEDLRGKIFECFSYLVRIAPSKAAAQSEALLSVLINSFSQTNNNLNEYIAICIDALAKNIPVSLLPHAASLSQSFVEILNRPLPRSIEEEAAKQKLKDEEEAVDEQEPEDTDDANDEDDPHVRMVSKVLTAYASLVNELNAELHEIIPSFVEILTKFIDGPAKIQAHAFKALFYSIDALASLEGFNPGQLFESTIRKIQSSGDPTIVVEAYYALGGLFIAFGSMMNEAMLKECIDLYAQIFADQIDQGIENALFFSLRQLIFSVGRERLNVIGQPILEILTGQLGAKKKTLIHYYIIHTLAALVFALPDNQAAEVIVPSATNMLGTTKQIDMKNILFSSLNMLIAARSDLFNAKEINKIKNDAEKIINDKNMDDMFQTTAATVWCTISRVKNQQLNERVLAEVIKKMPPVDDDDIPFAAFFINFIAQTHGPDFVLNHFAGTAVNTLASGTWLTNIIGHEILSVIASIVARIPEENIVEILEGNQHAFRTVMKNMAAYGSK